MPYGRQLGDALLKIARNAIGVELGRARDAESIDDGNNGALAAPGATFVTLTQRGELRGCVGSLSATRALRRDVHANAIAAAFRDPRFPALRSSEFDATSVEVSLLSASVPVSFDDEASLFASLVPGVDGVILEYDGHKATFLPQVWESLADPRQFLAALKRKAGLPENFWSPRVRVARYSVTKWTERESRTASAT